MVVQYYNPYDPQPSPTIESNTLHNKNGPVSQKPPKKSWFFHGLCFVLHGVLVCVHFFILLIWITRIEHKVVFPIGKRSNILSTALVQVSPIISTIYISGLILVSQQLATRRNIHARQRLTATHDNMSAWSGLRAALISVWRQTSIAASRIVKPFDGITGNWTVDTAYDDHVQPIPALAPNIFKWLRYYSYNFQDPWCHSLFYTSANITDSQGSTGKLVILNPPMRPGARMDASRLYERQMSATSMRQPFTQRKFSGCTVTLINQTAVVDAQSHLLQRVYPPGRKTSSTWSQWNPQTIPANATVSSSPQAQTPLSLIQAQREVHSRRIPTQSHRFLHKHLETQIQNPHLPNRILLSAVNRLPVQQQSNSDPAPPSSGDTSSSSQSGGNTSQQGSNNTPASGTGNSNSGQQDSGQQNSGGQKNSGTSQQSGGEQGGSQSASAVPPGIPEATSTTSSAAQANSSGQFGSVTYYDMSNVFLDVWWEMFSQAAISRFSSTNDCPGFPWSNSEACDPLTVVEQFIIEDLGLHCILLDSPVRPAPKITLHDLENSLASATAASYWTASRLKNDDPYNIENVNNYKVEAMTDNATISYPFTVTRLNINLTPLLLGLAASIGLLLLVS
ncbi:uncharacterized protein EV420DRAFT_1648554 [Desarmillaria tabescens]|uniref:Uncharacterized protein n=1 Tax=Armillaria tabescens TaxID=1929756 RepID=A0AA39MSI9_ARMTA|nr:uncharacterized protein EV420DRAFT_1648554 [Desarmillaria tabescens]KAK0445037.1 hypothetical protein EV420DRAFT_1648554 [Desarmillaria tabescens]